MRPAEFRYDDNLGKPWARALRRSLKLALGFDPAPPRELVQAFASAYYDGDPFAEALVGEARDTNRDAALRALAEEVERSPIEQAT